MAILQTCKTNIYSQCLHYHLIGLNATHFFREKLFLAVSKNLNTHTSMPTHTTGISYCVVLNNSYTLTFSYIDFKI